MLLKISSFCTTHRPSVSTGYTKQIIPILRKPWPPQLFSLELLATDRVENPVYKSNSIVVCVFVAVGTCLPSRCPETVAVTESPLSNESIRHNNIKSILRFQQTPLHYQNVKGYALGLTSISCSILFVYFNKIYFFLICVNKGYIKASPKF
jgi:hypothetical protein